MNKNILHTDVQEFISCNLNSDITSILLKKPFFSHISNKEIAEQILAKQKCQKKLPTWYNAPNIYFPHKLNVEQTSSEETATYKSELVDGKRVLDLTGGLGVDSYFFSKKADTVIHCEINDELSDIAAHNFQVLGAGNVRSLSCDGLAYVKAMPDSFDWIYVDPSRRNDLKGKVFQLADCLPNVPEHLDLLFGKANHILIKTSPLLDLSIGINELKFVKEIHIVAVHNEVKELLWILQSGFTGDVQIKTINSIKGQRQYFNFPILDEKMAVPTYSPPQKYLYEPNASILKSGAFKTIGNTYGLFKLHEHTHLYTSERHIEFPGRSFKIENVYPYKDIGFKKTSLTKANVTARNFPQTVSQIRKKHKIEDGGTIYLFFCKTTDGLLTVIKCSRM